MMKRTQTLGILSVVFFSLVTLANAQNPVNVTVPGNATGNFGHPSRAGQPFIAALAVNGPGTITVSYLSGVVTDCCPNFSTGPNGILFDGGTSQSPLQEANGVAGGSNPDTDALIAEFVPKSRTLASGFAAVDGTKGLVRVGLLPADLVFIGTGKIIPVKEAGTLFLGINDCNAESNGGAFTVSITFTPAN